MGRHKAEMPPTLSGLLEALLAAADGQELTLGRLFAMMNARGLAAAMLVPTLLMLMPFGLFPGSNALLGLVMAFVAGHIALGLRNLWLPRRLRQVALSGRLMRRGLRRLLPLAAWLDARTGRRLALLAEGEAATRLAGLVMLGLSLFAAIAGLIPGIPTLVSAVVLLLALGLLLRDGVVMAVGYAATLAAVAGVAALWPGA